MAIESSRNVKMSKSICTYLNYIHNTTLICLGKHHKTAWACFSTRKKEITVFTSLRDAAQVGAAFN